MELDTRCPVCNRLDEDGGHCFLKYKFVKHDWIDLHLEHVRRKLLAKKSEWEVVREVLDLNEEDRLKAVVMLWRWWNARNKVNNGERGFSREVFA